MRVSVKSTDEMGKLGSSFNNMLEKLYKAQEELKEYHAQRMEKAEKLAS